ncbi:MAG: hypothetical protein K0U84_22105 [Actinomycetia bacterium]|nr:hypothetical protein [Actinomycetes bacterium]
MLAFNLPDGTLEVSRVSPGGNWITHILGRPVGDPVAALACRLDCQPSDVTRILRASGDQELADFLDDI